MSWKSKYLRPDVSQRMVQSGKGDWHIFDAAGNELAGPYATKTQAKCECLPDMGKVTIRRKVSPQE